MPNDAQSGNNDYHLRGITKLRELAANMRLKFPETAADLDVVIAALHSDHRDALGRLEKAEGVCKIAQAFVAAHTDGIGELDDLYEDLEDGLSVWEAHNAQTVPWSEVKAKAGLV